MFRKSHSFKREGYIFYMVFNFAMKTFTKANWQPKGKSVNQ